MRKARFSEFLATCVREGPQVVTRHGEETAVLVPMAEWNLLDTNIVSELRKPRPSTAVVAWLEAAEERHLHLSAVTIGEIQEVIKLTRAQDPAKAAEIEVWADLLAESYNVLSMDAPCFRRWAKLMHRASNTVYEDAMIAATALVHNLTVVTRNVRDFARFDVPVLNLFKR